MRVGDIIEVKMQHGRVRGRILPSSTVADDGFGYIDFETKDGKWQYIGICPNEPRILVVERIGKGRKLDIKECEHGTSKGIRNSRSIAARSLRSDPRRKR